MHRKRKKEDDMKDHEMATGEGKELYIANIYHCDPSLPGSCMAKWRAGSSDIIYP